MIFSKRVVMENVLLEVQGLETQFINPDGTVHAINGVSFSVANGETIGRQISETIHLHLGLNPDQARKRAAELFRNPQHPYTLGLLGSLPRLDQREPLLSIDGLPPVLHEKPGYYPFAARSSYVTEKCRQANPILEEIAPDHRVAWWVKPKTRSVQP
jgi:oligopeptide/dipeptide ABC transporter ATP-binding protein